MRRRRTGTIKAENRVVWILCLLLGFAISVLSCAGDGSTLDPQGNPLGPPQIQVAPGQVSLSLTQETVDTVSVTVTNVGGFPLTVLSVSSDVPWATMLVASKALGQDESLEILIRIDATDIPLGSSEGTLTILSDDAESPSETIAIVLTVTEMPLPEINVNPLDLSAEIVEGESDTLTVTIQNLGSADLALSSLVSTVDWITPLALSDETVPPGGSVFLKLLINTSLLQATSAEGAVEIISNDSDESSVVVNIMVSVQMSGPFPPTLSAIQENVFSAICINCHVPGGTGPFTLEEGESFDNLVGVDSSIGIPRVDPGDPENSYMIWKLEGRNGIVGDQMPPFFSGEPPLPQEQIDVIKEWILRGANND